MGAWVAAVGTLTEEFHPEEDLPLGRAEVRITASAHAPFDPQIRSITGAFEPPGQQPLETRCPAEERTKSRAALIQSLGGCWPRIPGRAHGRWCPLLHPVCPSFPGHWQSRMTGPSTGKPTVEPTFVVEREFGAKGDLFVEYIGDYRTRNRPSVSGGWHVTRRQQLDFHVGVGLTRISPDHYVGVGYSFRLDSLFGGPDRAQTR